MKVFCWDFDGTLTHSDSLWGRSIFAVLRAAVPQASDALCQAVRESLWGKYPWDTPEHDDGTCRGEAWWDFVERLLMEGCLAQGISPAHAEKAAALFRPTVKQPSRYTLYADAIPVLRELKTRGAKNVLLSNNFPDLGEVAEDLAITPYLSDMVVSGEVGYNKPREEIFASAKRLYPGAEYFMVGDNLRADVLGGRESGMKTVFVHRGVCEQADYCFDDLKSVLSLL